MLLNSTLEGDSPENLMTPNAWPVGRDQEKSSIIPASQAFECINKIEGVDKIWPV